ncbi:ribonuclease III [Leptospira alstonii]|uniref:Ribonuclease 3 n=2 Tax=Leptospira alstonii TaxID=28452 RepID=M6CRZ5_9LEPT|nr:ribonuclease III [Leptospira alstonii]EMJ91668.1 ribonuclease III [Leptospira alstonii serovar Sichuan str. 79601]EQA81821.1 ribonuclease III [Leptospira alstonii serovar Pingchang str. 80-412]
MIFKKTQPSLKSPERVQSLQKLSKKIGIKFSKIEYYNTAFIHSSYKNENPEILEDNERLEFLGDSVLGLVAARSLFQKYPKASEGELSRIKSRIVSTPILNSIAEKLELGEYLLLGKGEKSSQGKGRRKLSANLFESLIGAIYLDQGFDVAEKFIVQYLSEFAENPEKEESVRDYKTQLQEYSQKHFKVLPVYRIQGESGPDHSKVFQVGVRIRDQWEASGSGVSKKAAEQNAARELYNRIRRGNKNPVR